MAEKIYGGNGYLEIEVGGECNFVDHIVCNSKNSLRKIFMLNFLKVIVLYD